MAFTSSHLKIAAATVTVIAIFLGFLERWNSPAAMLTEDSPAYPSWLGWLGWILASVGAVAYIVIDLLSIQKTKNSPELPQTASLDPGLELVSEKNVTTTNGTEPMITSSGASTSSDATLLRHEGTATSYLGVIPKQEKQAPKCLQKQN